LAFLAEAVNQGIHPKEVKDIIPNTKEFNNNSAKREQIDSEI
jgi:hypothetical protein